VSLLDGLVVVDLSTRIAGAYCTKLLGDAGAEVVKVEPPGGDPLRRFVASGTAVGDGEDGALFAYLCAGTSSTLCDLDTAGGRRELVDLVAGADLVVDTLGPGRLDALGLGFDDLVAHQPALVQVAISDFGRDGPWATRAATEFTLQGWCGATGFRGWPDRPPLSVGGQVGEYAGGVAAAVAGLAALRRARATGRGELADVSLLECMVVAMQSSEWLHVALMDLPGFSRSVEVPSIERASDGWVGFTMVTAQQWDDFATMVGQPVLATDPELRLQLGRWPRRAEVEAAIAPWLSARTVDEVVEEATLFRLPVATLGNGATVTGEDHFVERGVFFRQPAGFRQPRPPWRMAEVAPRPLAAAPPLPREGAVAPTVRPTAGAPLEVGRGSLPLDGVRVVDFTAFWAGPSASHLLAALGADVVKVESVQRPDGMRFAGGQKEGAERWWELSWVFHAVNVNKRSVTIDLGRPEGNALARRLIATADVVIENFSPRVIEQFGLGWETLAEIRPDLLMVRMPAFGLDGPWRDRVGFAPTMEQISGMAWLTGFAGEQPVAPRGACDPLSGYHAVFALLAALAWRERTGRGSLVEVPMIEVALNVTAQQVAEYDAYGVLLERAGNRGPAAAPQNVYACAGDDRWLALAVADDEQWPALVAVLGSPAWATDPGLLTAAGRRAAHDLLDERLAEHFGPADLDESVARLAAAGVPAAPVVLPPDVVANEQLVARRFFEPVHHPLTGTNLYARPPFVLSGGPDRWYGRPPPLLGEHNDEVLGGELGLSDAELDRLRAEHVIGEWPAGL